MQQADKIFKKAKDIIDSSCDKEEFIADDLYLPNLQKAIDPTEILQLAEMIGRELREPKKRKKMKVTAIKIEKSIGGQLVFSYRYEETKFVEETIE